MEGLGILPPTTPQQSFPSQKLSTLQKQQPIQSNSNFGLVTIVSTETPTLPPPPSNLSSKHTIHKLDNNGGAQKDLFGLEPFPQVISKTITPEGNNNIQLLKTDLRSEPIQLVTVNHSIIINKTPEPQQAISSRINYQNVSLQNSQEFYPIADSEFIQITSEICSDFTPDDEEEPVVICATKPKKEKSHSAGFVTLPAKISQKISNVGTYKKVSSSGSSSKNKKQQQQHFEDEDSNGYFQSNTIQSSKAGFSNMSFEDFPSDQEIDRMSKTIPFEVVRNEKMLCEAEKKFGSLKRRSNLFS